MSIKSIRLCNFRGFSDARIDLKPLTVLLGPNSAGKSSFGHALAAMSHAHRTFAGTPQATLTPPANDADKWPVDLGNLLDLRTHGATGPVKIILGTAEGPVELGFGLESVGGLLPSYFLHPKGGESGGTHPEAETTARNQSKEMASTAQTGVGGEILIDSSDQSRWYDVRRLNEQQWQERGAPSIVILDGLLLRAVTGHGGTPRLLSGSATDELKFLFDSLVYLRATRKRPSRSYLQDRGRPQEIGYAGEWTATVLKSRAEEIVQYAELAEIPDTVQQAQGINGRLSYSKEATLLTAVSAWLQRLQLASSLDSRLSENNNARLQILVTLPNQQAHNIVEVGFGTSQIVPVLTAGLLQPKNSLFIVDLPEAHLHPRPQADLADFFCSLALSGRSSLVETHSEMFFHRLRLRAEMDDELKKRIAVYFIDQPKGGVCCNPRPVGLGFDEEPHWPEGFLQEAWTMEEQIAAVRQAKRSVEK